MSSRYILTYDGRLSWSVTDSETGVRLSYLDGRFNDSQRTSIPDMPGDDIALSVAGSLRGIGDYMATEHPLISLCSVPERMYLLVLLSGDGWLENVVEACREITCDEIDEYGTDALRMYVEDYIAEAEGGVIDMDQQLGLISAVSRIDDKAVMELVRMITAYWTEYMPMGVSKAKWAEDMRSWASKM